MKFKKLAIASLAGAAVLTVASCGGDKGSTLNTYRIATTVSPSNWNELTYQDNNDTQIMEYLSTNLFSFDYKIENGAIVDGDFTVKYNAATKLEDVTKTYATDDKYDVPDNAKSGYAYKITLRNDLKWDDGTAINADDFIYTMKEQLNPLFLNYRADSYYNGATVLHNAENYVKQGQSGWFPSRSVVGTWVDEDNDNLVFKLGPSTSKDSTESASAVSNYRTAMEFPASYDAEKTAEYTAAKAKVTKEAVVALEGKTYTQIRANADYLATFRAILNWWQTEPNEELDFFVSSYTYPEMTFDKVGFFKGNTDYELVLVLDTALELLESDGSLSYKAAYNMQSLPLVKKDLYEANKVAPATGSTLWTSTYNSSVASTASWGPYKLTEFQAGKSYKLEKNPNWFGYSLEENKGLYQTDVISCETIKEYETQLLKFLAGEIDNIGIDVSVSATYKNSEQAVYTPSSYVGSLQLQSSASSLKNRETTGVDKEILTNVKFRKAISLSFDRVAYTQTCTTSSKPGFGIFNSMHYYDVAHGGAYRNTDDAKKTLCEVYGIDVSKYDSLDKAYAAITGYDIAQAKTLVEEAYQEELAAGRISASDNVLLTVGTSAINESTQRQFEFIKKSLENMVKGTSLEGRVSAELVDKGEKWADDFRSGSYDICTGGWSGAAWDPGYFLLAYLSPDYMYSAEWDTSSATMTYTVKGGNTTTGEDVTATMSLTAWYDCLNGKSSAQYNWAAGVLNDESRCGLIAALEKEILTVYYTVPISYSFSAELISYKAEYASRTYNTFMGYGGIKYMTYKYNDGAWAEFVASQGGKIDYTK